MLSFSVVLLRNGIEVKFEGVEWSGEGKRAGRRGRGIPCNKSMSFLFFVCLLWCWYVCGCEDVRRAWWLCMWMDVMWMDRRE